MPSLPKLLVLASLALLGACQLLPPGGQAPASYERHAWEHHQPGCTGKSCPFVNVDTLHFPSEPALNQLIERRLLAMTCFEPDTSVPSSFPAYERDYFRAAQPDENTYLQAKILEQHNGRIVIELSSYLSTGGAHGMPGRGFINYDRQQKRELGLKELLLPGQEASFWKLAAQAHQRWLKEKGHSSDPEFLEFWKFERTRNIALLKDRILLKYDVYSIAPYASGHPELSISKQQLNGILKPDYL
jgi:hypothetical protein